jgi:hypothetical protein
MADRQPAGSRYSGDSEEIDLDVARAGLKGALQMPAN